MPSYEADLLALAERLSCECPCKGGTPCGRDCPCGRPYMSGSCLVCHGPPFGRVYPLQERCALPHYQGNYHGSSEASYCCGWVPRALGPGTLEAAAFRCGIYTRLTWSIQTHGGQDTGSPWPTIEAFGDEGKRAFATYDPADEQSIAHAMVRAILGVLK